MLAPRSLVAGLLLAYVAVAVADAPEGGDGNVTVIPEDAHSGSEVVVSSIPFSDSTDDTSTLFYSFETMAWPTTLGVALVTQNVSAVALQAGLADFKHEALARRGTEAAPTIEMESQNLTFSLLPLNGTSQVQWAWAQAVTAVLPSLYERGLPSLDRTVLMSVRHASSERSDYMARIESKDDTKQLDLQLKGQGPSRSLLMLAQQGSREFERIRQFPNRESMTERHRLQWRVSGLCWVTIEEALGGWGQILALVQRANRIASSAPGSRLNFRGLRAQVGHWELLLRVPSSITDGHQLEFYMSMVREVLSAVVEEQMYRLMEGVVAVAGQRLGRFGGELATGFMGQIQNRIVEASFEISYSTTRPALPEAQRNCVFGDPRPRRLPDEL